MKRIWKLYRESLPCEGLAAAEARPATAGLISNMSDIAYGSIRQTNVKHNKHFDASAGCADACLLVSRVYDHRRENIQVE